MVRETLEETTINNSVPFLGKHGLQKASNNEDRSASPKGLKSMGNSSESPGALLRQSLITPAEPSQAPGQAACKAGQRCSLAAPKSSSSPDGDGGRPRLAWPRGAVYPGFVAKSIGGFPDGGEKWAVSWHAGRQRGRSDSLPFSGGCPGVHNTLPLLCYRGSEEPTPAKRTRFPAFIPAS